MRRTLLLLAATAALGACSSLPEEVFTGQRDCGYIGCENGGLRVYKHEQWGATEQPKRWYGWDWGTSSSAFEPGTPEHTKALAEECARAATYGLDCMGRPLNQN
jgi:hypothetical protein